MLMWSFLTVNIPQRPLKFPYCVSWLFLSFSFPFSLFVCGIWHVPKEKLLYFGDASSNLLFRFDGTDLKQSCSALIRSHENLFACKHACHAKMLTHTLFVWKQKQSNANPEIIDAEQHCFKLRECTIVRDGYRFRSITFDRNSIMQTPGHQLKAWFFGQKFAKVG